MNDHRTHDTGISDALGSVLLISVIALGIAVASVAILSSPVPQKVPSLSVDVMNTSDTVYLRHSGGDTLAAGEYRVLADDIDRTSQFLYQGAPPARWSAGDMLEYHAGSPGQIPASIRIIAFTGRGEQVVLQVQLRPPGTGPAPTGSPTGTATTMTTATATPTATATTTVVPAPVAVFNGSPVSGTRPLIVQFTDMSANSPTSWSWDFGDGITSTTRNASHTYTAAGTYTVSLTASNAGGSSTESRVGYITVTNPPTMIAKYVLMYAQTASASRRNTPVPGFDPIPDGAVILPSQYNNEPITIRAITDPLPTGSVRLVLSGAGSRNQIENTDPYCLFGDDPHWEYNPWVPTPPGYGSYQLTGTPYTGTAGTGIAGPQLIINFTLAPPPGPSVIFSDNFDTTFSGWTTSGDVSQYTGTPHSGIAGIQLRLTGLMQRTIQTTGYSDIVVSFALGANNIESGEYVVAEWSPDGSTWNVLEQINNGDPEEDNALHPFSSTLPASAGNNPAFALRFRVAGNNDSDRGYVDDVVVRGIAA